MKRKAICPECKNDLDFSSYPALSEGMIIECNQCGITLLIKKIEKNELAEETISTEIVDEGK